MVVCAPTMFLGGEDLRGTRNVEAAFGAALSLWCSLADRPETSGLAVTLACPMMGAGVGMLPPSEAAAQMRAAYDHALAKRAHVGQ
jgi:O-acetyl-ADP-ribose deacetylase (regulator of RNase III)